VSRGPGCSASTPLRTHPEVHPPHHQTNARPPPNRFVKLLAEAARRGDGPGRSACCALLRLLVACCHESPAAVAQLLTPAGHLALLVDLAGGRVGGSSSGEAAAHLPGLAALLLGVCLMYAPDSVWARQHQQQLGYQQQPGGVSQVILDVLLQRLGLSHFFGRLDDMSNTKALQAARAGPRMPGHITRAAAAAVLDRDAAAAANGVMGGAAHHQHGAADSGDDVVVVGLYDQPFAVLVQQAIAAVKQIALEAFSGGSGSAAGLPPPPPPPGQAAAAGFPAPSSASPPALSQPPPPPMLPLQAPPGGLSPHSAAAAPHHQQHPSSLLPAAPALPGAGPAAAAPPRPFMPSLPGMEQQQQQQQAPFGVQHAHPHQQPPTPPPQQPQQQQPTAVAPDAAAALAAAQQQQFHHQQQQQQLAVALAAVARLQAEVEDLRSRNRAMAEDLVRASSQTAASAAAGGSADAEARAVMQLRATRAEMEVGTLR